MTDTIDQAQAFDAMHRGLELAEAAARRRKASRPTGPEHTLCESCEDPIPEARRLAVPGTQWCADCAAAREAKGRRP